MAETRETIVSLEDIIKIYHGRTVVDSVSLNVGCGEIVGLLGPNGAGKTTTFYSVIGLVKPDGGRIIFQGHDITDMPMFERARLGIGYLSQEPSIFRKLTVEENVRAILETMDLSISEMDAQVSKLLGELDLTKLAGQKAYTLSGGERRKLEITRALARKPSLLMLDEPFSGVDPLAVQDLQGIIRTLRDRGLAVLITDHNVRETLAVVDRAYLMYEGKVLREGASSFLINDEVSRELYLGQKFSM
jgi:lipopolysaccharide export system ATP-binding protein